MRRTYRFFSRGSRKFFGFVIICNFGIILYNILSIVTLGEEVVLSDPIGTKSIEIHENQSSILKGIYENYFRVDYTIKHGICKPIYLFNTTKTILSIENLTNIKFNRIMRDVAIDISILSINPILINTEKIRKNVAFKYLKSVCSYVLELYIGFNFPSHCHSFCQSRVMKYLTSRTRPFGHPLDEPFTFILYRSDTNETKIKYSIHEVLLFRSSKYLNKLVYIRSYDKPRYLSALIADASSFQSSITMSQLDQTLFNITDALDKNSYENDCSLIFFSFSTILAPNIYLRHETGRIKLRKNDQSALFKQDATFKLLMSSTTKDMVAFESINVPHSYIAVDSDTETSLVLTELKLKVNGPMKTIEDLDNRFLFKFIFNEQ